ncbi:hypothetical protein E8E12_001422 [Didymella heteroderae]|uniref:Arrestin-like N-terminal domain-containing protein n=1 Tax=Didymella heteroderae TaxID=1769908 RepID=A0A9P5BVT2_9PLEO|nr:hypothetical protein E8E12_001422 [Didymella heteroderae]
MLPIPCVQRSKGSTASNLGIRLDSPVVNVEAGQVSGRVIFMNNTNVRVKRITMTLHGAQQVLWYTNTMTSDRVRSRDTLFSQDVDLMSMCNPEGGSPCLLAPDNFVWPFEFDLGSCPFESVDGLGDTFVKYNLCVTVITAGRFAKNLCAVKEVKVIRTPGLEEVNDTEPDQDIYGLWPGKLDYHITTSPQFHHWGLPITTSLRVQPLMEGVEIESVKLRLVESFRLKASSKHRDLFHRREFTVSEVEATEQDNAVLHLRSSTTIWNDEWEVALPLPTSLRACRQSLRQGRITIVHKLLVDLRARDKDGAAHSVSYHFPLVLKFPPGISFDDQGTASFPHDAAYLHHNARRPAIPLVAPPAFGDHDRDPIYRPGMMLQPVEDQSEHHPGTTVEGQFRRTSLCTRQLFRFTSPEMFSSPCNRRDSLQPICLDQAPNYCTAISSPEIFSNDIDPSPAYSAPIMAT